ncbi:hypothetical protein ABZ477_11160 [Microbacterium sp. NPDC019599]|uniref:hypothetical protein n=1 Tax=Microbacterium sp. NPDC019599 TaxID=3154690 RepID=UPI0033F10C52
MSDQTPAPIGTTEPVPEEDGGGAPSTGAAPPDEIVRGGELTLELRVHGVNNTTPASLLDLPPEAIRRLAGDTLGSFWAPTKESLDTTTPDSRGFVPEGIQREAYSWGGMVRTVPTAGVFSAGGVVLGVITRVFYALILPFSLANAAQWTRRLTQPGDSRGRQGWIAFTSGLTRLFCFVLTLLFTTTMATLALDIGASQCGAEPALCGPLSGVFGPMKDWSPGQRLALMALIPVGLAAVLWVLSAMSRLRYDNLPGMQDHGGDGARKPPAAGAADARPVPAPPVAEQSRASRREPEAAPPAVLSKAGFWSNRVTRHLARVHLAGALLLTAGFVATQASMAWRTDCGGLVFGDCTTTDDGWFPFYVAMAVVALVGVVAAAVAASILPTMRVAPEEEQRLGWANLASGIVLGVGILVFVVTCGFVAFTPAPPVGVDRLYGAGMTPTVIVAIAAGIAVIALTFRPFAGRRAAAWWGCGPALFMIVSLALSSAISAIIVVAIGDWLNGSQGPAALVGWRQVAEEQPGRVSIDWSDSQSGLTGETTVGTPPADIGGLRISSSYVALGSAIIVFLAIAFILVLAAAFIRRRNLVPRASAWRMGPPDKPGSVPISDEDIPIGEGGILPPSARTLWRRIEAKRGSAARLHLLEPVAGVFAVAMAVGIGVGLFWTIYAYQRETSLWGIAPADMQQFVVDAMEVSMLGLAALAAVIVAILAAGAGSGSSSRPLGLAWDIACYLPQTGHPFGPPCYAERAVPEIAGRINHWLREPGRQDRRVVLAAHSMGGVLAVSALGVLASSPTTRDQLPRIGLLTFGVQLRTFFGRMLPEMLGPTVLGTTPLVHGPGLLSKDPWEKDFQQQHGPSSKPPETEPASLGIGRVAGTLAPPRRYEPEHPIRWISLWRLTDFLGYPASSTVKFDGEEQIVNRVDRYAGELDKSGYMVTVGTHGEYYRTLEYYAALDDLKDELEATGSG